MTLVAEFSFNPFQENTYVIYEEKGECIIIDPGCYTQSERDQLVDFIEQAELTPVRLLNTHCHLDHVFGNKFVMDKYGLGLEIHKGELPVLDSVPRVAEMYGIPNVIPSPAPTAFLKEGDVVSFGKESTLKVLFTPGHSPASISFYNEKEKYVISGDVLFQGSIGRTDLPGGDFNTLIQSIKSQIFPLGDEVRVYSGHGGSTTVGEEKKSNPFLQ